METSHPHGRSKKINVDVDELQVIFSRTFIPFVLSYIDGIETDEPITTFLRGKNIVLICQQASNIQIPS